MKQLTAIGNLQWAICKNHNKKGAELITAP